MARNERPIRYFRPSITTLRKFRLALIASGVFVLFLTYFEWTAFAEYRRTALLDAARFTEATESGKYILSSIVGFCCLFAVQYVLVFLSLISNAVFRVIYLSIFTAVSFYEYAIQQLFHRFSTIQDITLVFFTTGPQKTAAIASYWTWLAVIPCAGYLALLLLVRPAARISLVRSAAAFLVLTFVVVGFNFAAWIVAPKFYLMDSMVTSFGAADRSIFGYFFSDLLTYNIAREEVAAAKPQPTPLSNIVFILDESVRADHLSLNGYERPTTPYLQELESKGLLKNYGTAISGSTRSLESLKMLMTGLTHNDLGNIENLLDRYPTIFQFANASGYRTIYLDGQINRFWAGRPDDQKYIDLFYNADHINPNHEPDWGNDKKIAERLLEIVTTSTGNFIFVFKYGDHASYGYDFPPDAAVWLPISNEVDYSVLMRDHQTLINSYDNAVRFNLETFFRTLLPDEAVPQNSTFIYTSDHGQTLSDNGEDYSHGGQTLNEAMVPLFLVGNNVGKLDNGFKASHENIFATLLDLMGYPEELRQHRYAISLLSAKRADSGDRYFVVPEFIHKQAVRVSADCCK